MRTLIQLVILRDSRQEVESKVLEWLDRCGFIPRSIEQTEKIITALQATTPKVMEELTKGLKPEEARAIEILSTIPLEEGERDAASRTAKFVISYVDDEHNITVWGLVCVEVMRVSIRWRHPSSHTLERACNDLVENVWDVSGKGNLFEPFKQGQSIAVREPNSNRDVYTGKIIGPGKLRQQRAKEEKGTELFILYSTLFLAGFFSVLGYYYSGSSSSDIRWFAGFCDRLATGFFAISLVTGLNYYLYMNSIKKKPIIDWT